MDHKSKIPVLNKETTAIWKAWSLLGNREVAREAAAKGTHVNLAIQFLSTRNDISQIDAEAWLKKEVHLWVNELLNRKQIHKSKHILNNVGFKAVDELLNIFLRTESFETRKYIGDHLSELKVLDENTKNLWAFLESIHTNHASVSNFATCNSIDELQCKSPEWHSKVATILFLIVYETHLIPYIKPLDLFKYLIATNNELIKHWIAITFGNFEKTTQLNPNLCNMFKENTLTEEMLELLNNEHLGLSDTLKDDIFSELCKYGVFQKEEKTNCVKLLNRFLKYDISSIYKTLEQESSTVSINQFVRMLTDYCVENNILSVLSACSDYLPLNKLQNLVSPHVDMLIQFKSIQWDSEDNIREIIMNTVDYIKTCDYKEYFEKNPIVLCSLILFTKDVKFLESFDTKLTVSGVEISKYFNSILSKYHIVRKLYNKSKNNHTYTSKSFYNLIEDHLKIKIEKLFEYKFGYLEPPHFNCDRLVQAYGYKKKLDYDFYIKELRPSSAAKLVVLNQLETSDENKDEILQKQLRKVFKIAINDFGNKELTCSCICFQEMIGVPADGLRIHLNVINRLCKAGYDAAYCKDMFRQLENTAHEIQNILENILIENIDFEFKTGMDFVEAKNEYELVMKFSRENNIRLPEGFLRQCAMKNDWLYFLIFAQIHTYPIDQIKEVCQCFKNPFYLEHILHCVTYDIQVEDENILMRERDSRKAFLSRIGLRQSTDSLTQSDSRSATKSQSSFAMSDSSDILEIDILNTKATLLQILIQCHNSQDPPRALLQACQLYRNPLLAIFATSYEPDSVHTNWLTWLAVSCELYQSFTNLEGVVMLANATRDLLNKAMEKGFPRTLLKSFRIFFPESSLRHFLEFLCLGVEHIFDLNIMSNELELFKKSLKRCRKASVFQEADHDITYLTNRSWIEETSLMLMASALEYNYQSSYEQIMFVEALCELKIQEVFIIEVPNFRDILTILTILYENKSKTWVNFPTLFSAVHHRESVIACLNNLLDEKLFDVALKIAQIGNLPNDLVILMKWQDKFESRVEHTKFWEICNESFKEHNVTADRVIEFYLNMSEKLTNSLEKYEISKYAYQWAREFELSSQYDLEKQMILHYMNLEEKYKNEDLLYVKPDNILYKDMLDMLDDVPICSLPICKDIETQAEKLINFALEKCDFFFALRLEKMFTCENSDVEILKLSYSLAEGLQMPYQLNTKERMLLTKVSNFRRYSSNRKALLSTRLSSFSSIASHSSLAFTPNLNSEVTFDSPNQDTLNIIQTLSEKLVKGSEIATNILMTYRVSINIQIPYHVIVSNPDDMNLLKNALEMDCSNKLEVVHDFILIYKWNKNQIADLICEELINHLNYHIKSKAETLIMWDLNLNTDFNYILRLLQDDCSVLGNRLFSYARTVFEAYIASNNDIKISEVAFIIELIIRAHDCFTSDCNMEGISAILSKCQKIVMHLVTLRSWKLIVRLLTAIARYTEMNYVFQILKENDQFEFLLRKGSRQDSALKIALLEYLRKYCPDNRDLYKMVALHFALFSEVALLWERDAKSVMKNLIGISKLEMQNNKINPDTEPYVIFTNTDGTRLCLSKAMENYTYATEFHLQGEKLTKAMHTAKQAELLAVQLSLFNGLAASASAVCILELENSQIFNLISSQLSFEQSLILVEAYNYQTDWALVLFTQCIIQNNMKYLESFLNHLPLTESITRDICRRFLSNFSTITQEGILNMKVILNKLPSVHAKYQIASELGFSDIVEDLITTGQLCYLKDTVWKRGYKNT